MPDLAGRIGEEARPLRERVGEAAHGARSRANDLACVMRDSLKLTCVRALDGDMANMSKLA